MFVPEQQTEWLLAQLFFFFTVVQMLKCSARAEKTLFSYGYESSISCIPLIPNKSSQ